ncbi:MAG: DNA starvation/stationary phase protection protein Dps [Sphaerospermopsis sp. SIO1G2]|nr:DNA starvation/stationary phase protection protein Dps [Sphaerospermopsis sp. SIO1G2]
MIGKMHATSHDMPLEAREAMVALCNQQLANIFDLYAQTKQAHWNVKGMHFEALHVLFDKMADSVFPFGDEIAERATALGGTALGTVRMAAGATELPEFPDDVFDGETMVKIVVERWAQVAASMRASISQAEAANDMVTADMFTGIGAEVDKLLWFAESHLQ